MVHDGCRTHCVGNPDCIQGFRDWLFAEAESTTFPHLLVRASAKQVLQGLVRASAKQALQGLEHADPKRFSDTERARIAAINTSRLVAQQSITESWQKGFDRHRPLGEEGRRFRFDSLDTLPYWYTPLMRGFAWPLAADAEEDSWDNFDHWLSRPGPTLAPAWLGDLRGPKPLEALAWQAPPLDGWLKTPDVDAFRRALGLDRPDWLVVSAYRSLQYGDVSGSTRIERALVSRDTATTLRLALEASENSHDYRLAVNDDDSLEIASGRFVLKSLLVDNHGDTELDIHDLLRGEVSASGQSPHPRIVALLGLVRDPSGLPVWRDPSGVVITHRIAWSDPK